MKALAETLRLDEAAQQSIVSETMAVLKDDSSLAAEIAPLDPTAIEEDVEV